MQTRLAMLFGFAVAAGLVPAGCNIENCEEGAICLDDDAPGRWCYATCRTLAECGRIADAQRGACMDACQEAAHQEEDALEDYRECIEDSSCSALNKECGKPPFSVPPVPQVDESLDGGVPTPDASTLLDASSPQEDGSAPLPDADSALDATVADAASDAATAGDAGADSGSAPCACAADVDCPAPQRCRGGLCRAPCAASCECPVGQVCQDMACVPPPPASLSCQSRCDCPSGESCVERLCVAPG